MERINKLNILKIINTSFVSLLSLEVKSFANYKKKEEENNRHESSLIGIDLLRGSNQEGLSESLDPRKINHNMVEYLQFEMNPSVEKPRNDGC